MAARGRATALAAAIVIAASGCQAKGDGAAAPAAAQTERAAAPRTATAIAPSGLRWSEGDCTLPSSPAAPLGRTAEALAAAFGRPEADTRFLLGRGLTPPRQVLLNRLPLQGNERTTVREMSWTRSGCSLTVWLVVRDRGWRAVQTLRGSDAAEY